jgi:hypothetical protein
MSIADLLGGETRSRFILIIVYSCMHHRGQIDHQGLDHRELSQAAYANDQVPGTLSYLAEILRISERGCDVNACSRLTNSEATQSIEGGG